MVKEVLQSIEGVAIYPIIAMLIFLVTFVMAVVAVWRMSPREVEYISRLPLNDSRPDGSGADEHDNLSADSGDK